MMRSAASRADECGGSTSPNASCRSALLARAGSDCHSATTVVCCAYCCNVAVIRQTLIDGSLRLFTRTKFPAGPRCTASQPMISIRNCTTSLVQLTLVLVRVLVRVSLVPMVHLVQLPLPVGVSHQQVRPDSGNPDSDSLTLCEQVMMMELTTSVLVQVLEPYGTPTAKLSLTCLPRHGATCAQPVPCLRYVR